MDSFTPFLHLTEDVSNHLPPINTASYAWPLIEIEPRSPWGGGREICTAPEFHLLDPIINNLYLIQRVLTPSLPSSAHFCFTPSASHTDTQANLFASIRASLCIASPLCLCEGQRQRQGRNVDELGWEALASAAVSQPPTSADLMHHASSTAGGGFNQRRVCLIKQLCDSAERGLQGEEGFLPDL